MYIFLKKVQVFTFVKSVLYVIVDSKPSQLLSGIIISQVGNEFLFASYEKNRRDKKRWLRRYSTVYNEDISRIHQGQEGGRAHNYPFRVSIRDY